MKYILILMLSRFTFDLSTPTKEAVWYQGLKSNTEDTLVCASYLYPKGSKVQITNLANNKAVVVRVTDRGPHNPDGSPHKTRVFDLSKEAFNVIANPRDGVIKIEYKCLE